MNQPEQHIYNAFIAFRAPDDFLERFQQFSANVGRNRSAVARHLIAKCLTSYENDKVAIAKIRQEIL
jgi:predicted DNA-binding protein